MWISRREWKELLKRLDFISDDIGALNRKVLNVQLVNQQIEKEIRMATTNLDKIKTAVERANAGIESVLALVGSQSAALKDMAQRLADAIASNDPVAQQQVQTDLDALADGLTAEADKIAAATQAPPA